MLKISAKSQYGLRAMVYLAGRKRNISSLKTISEKEEISFDYLEKIISKLEKAGLLKAKKGVQGGYFLAKSPGKIKVGEIIKTLEGELALVKCIAKTKRCICPRSKGCLTKNFWKKIQDSLNNTLNSLTLADLVKG
jgi:Rrf2 family protein